MNGRLGRSLLAGAAAGAAGTTALNLVTYLDMTVRGRPASDTPERTVERLAGTVGVDIPGDGDVRTARVSGIGAALGLATGVAVGAVAGLVRGGGVRLPYPVGAAVTTAGVLAAANGPMTVLGITDPRTWSATDWASDVVPHVAYATVTSAVLRRLLP
jgi:hypothetical protein